MTSPMTRTFATLALAGATILTPVLPAVAGQPAAAATPVEQQLHRTDDRAATPARATSRACRARLVNPRRAVKAKRFARCVVKGMQAGRTARVRTQPSGEGPSKAQMRFGRGTDVSVVMADGSRFVAIGSKAWHRAAGGRWVRARAHGTPEEVLAEGIRQLFLGLSSAQAYRTYLSASTTPWKWTGKERRINGVRAREYRGTPVVGGYSYTRYRVWLDTADRPIRVDTAMTMYGQRSTWRQDFSRWGAKVKIVAPTLG